ncbi:MAG: transglutaminase-like putative cysteine protease [Limisphaerales bacterium]|jgi:transglutaminase-like putative cysteine protease
MNRALNQLILLGFICQSLSWDGYLLFFVNLGIWFGCLQIAKRKPILLPPIAEVVLLLAGCGIGILIGQLPDQSAHFFIGHGMTLFLAGRLLRAMDRREQLFGMIAAIVQIGVACTVVLDYRFIPILIVTAFLIPRTLMELESDHFPKSTYSVWPRLRFSRMLAIMVIMCGFFAVFPRGLLSSAFPTLRPPGPDHGTLLDSVLDPSRGGTAGSSRIIMQVKGENLRYMRSFALTTIDGVKWLPDAMPGKNLNNFVSPEERVNYPRRQVRVKEVQSIGKFLPTDGRIVAIEGKFFSGPRRTIHEYIECQAVWTTANNVYEYWLEPNPEPHGLGRRYGRALLNYPPQSQELVEWLDKELTGIEEPLEQARHLENFFIDNFTYELGAPALNRVKPIDDFIFNERRGHCERYAAAMGLLLRMKGIHSRVMVGYVPGKTSWFSDWRNIRARDAHAWTEAYFPELGWVQLDATPRAEMDLSTSALRELIDALDVAWYVNIVNFDTAAQQGFFTSGVQGFMATAGWAKANSSWLVISVVCVALFLGWRSHRRGMTGSRDTGKPRKKAQILAGHYYGKMLRSLAQQGIERDVHMTPLEFMETLRERALPAFSDIQFVTRRFCAMRYGECALSEEDQQRIETALSRVDKPEADDSN